MSNLLDTPKLGFGCMRLPLTDPKDQKSIDIEHVKKMVDAFMEAGGTYFDTAYVYHEGESEVAMRKALVERYPRFIHPGHEVLGLGAAYRRSREGLL